MSEQERAGNQWKKARNSYGYLRSHIREKAGNDRYKLSIIDLVLVSNFKGGSATIAEPLDSLKCKLKCYEKKLSEIGKCFGDKKLACLTEEKLKRLITLASEFCQLATTKSTKIDGFGPSFATALLNANFPDLLPILDRRGLNGAGFENVKTNNQGQVRQIESHYPALIRYFHRRVQEPCMSLKKVDKEIFCRVLGTPFRRQ